MEERKRIGDDHCHEQVDNVKKQFETQTTMVIMLQPYSLLTDLSKEADYKAKALSITNYGSYNTRDLKNA